PCFGNFPAFQVSNPSRRQPPTVLKPFKIVLRERNPESKALSFLPPSQDDGNFPLIPDSFALFAANLDVEHGIVPGCASEMEETTTITRLRHEKATRNQPLSPS